MNRQHLAQNATPTLALSAVLLACLAACGGGAGSAPRDVAPDGASAAALAANEVEPAYHLAPVLLDEPDTADVGGTNASARQAPRRIEVDAALADLDTRHLTRAALEQRLNEVGRKRTAAASGANAPQAQAIVGAVHTPAQIRAAYGLPDLPATGATLTAAQAAALGAGQTVYIVDAYHDATALADLNAFSTRFGLPTCTAVAIPTTATLPLARPPASCTLVQVNTTSTGTMTATVPATNGTWAPESKLDVQWAHAMAPLARIVLLEMPDPLSTSILGANALAAKMGPGAVSMSFGSAEAVWAPGTDANFNAPGMTYVAAAGDSGTQVLWPAVLQHVIAVGGTSLNWSGTGTRYEAAWNRTGGGLSAYEPLPAWQAGLAPHGGGALVRRAVPDVAFNANPMTGEYVALTLPGAATVWQAYGGTSIAAPQWAGIVAVANALRAANGKAALGDFHAQLYQGIGAVPGTYAAAIGDVVDGSNGSCGTCAAGTGFDLATGWGTPNSSPLMLALGGTSTTTTTTPAANHAPTMGSATYSGRAGANFAASMFGRDADGGTLTYTVAGAPRGLSLSASGFMYWVGAVRGTYVMTVTVRDSHGATGSGVITLVIA